MQKSAAIFTTDPNKMLLFKLSNLMPFIISFLRMCMFAQISISQMLTRIIPSLAKYIPENPAAWIINNVKDVLALRIKSSSSAEKRVDLLQLMIDASTTETIQV